MKKLTVRSLVGSAVLLACGSVDLNAATVALTGAQSLVSSTEGNAAAATANGSASVTLRTLDFSLAGSGYVDGDVVTVTLGGGGAFRLGSLGAIDAVTACAEVDAAADADTDAMGLKLTSVNATTATYTVVNRDASEAASNIKCSLAGLEVLASSLTSYKILSINWSAATATGTVHDVLRRQEGNPPATTSIHASDTQLQFFRVNSSATSLIKADICNSTGTRPAQSCFATSSSNNADAGTSGVQSWTSVVAVYNPFTGADDVAAQNIGLVSSDAVVHTYTGNFSFLDNDNNGCSAADLTAGANRLVTTGSRAFTVPVAINAACTAITTRGAAGTDNLSFTTWNTTTGGKAIPAQSITAAAEFLNGATSLVAGVAASGWTFRVNGFSAQIPYMPYGSGISRIVYITNRTTTSGAVTFTARNEAGTTCASTSFPAVTAGSSRVTLLSAALDAGIASCYGADFNGKVVVDVVAAIPPSSADTLAVSSLSGAITGRTAAGAAVTAADGVAGAGGSNGSVGASATLALGSTTGAGTVTRATANADIYSAYNVNGNRVTVINTSNGR